MVDGTFHTEKQEAKLRFVGENTFIKNQQWRSNIRIEYRWLKEFFFSLPTKNKNEHLSQASNRTVLHTTYQVTSATKTSI